MVAKDLRGCCLAALCCSRTATRPWIEHLRADLFAGLTDKEGQSSLSISTYCAMSCKHHSQLCVTLGHHFQPSKAQTVQGDPTSDSQITGLMVQPKGLRMW